jgi:hypothetical protein
MYNLLCASENISQYKKLLRMHASEPFLRFCVTHFLLFSLSVFMHFSHKRSHCQNFLGEACRNNIQTAITLQVRGLLIKTSCITMCIHSNQKRFQRLYNDVKKRTRNRRMKTSKAVLALLLIASRKNISNDESKWPK